jgi:endonuclease-3
MPKPAADLITEKYGRAPFPTLIAGILSPRTRDTVSYPAAVRLLTKAKTPQAMTKLSLSEIQKLIYPVSFFRQKAKSIYAASQELVASYHGKVPKTQKELVSLPGVGVKVANVVLAHAYRQPAIIVDTHVQRLCNSPHFGLVHTKNPKQTQLALEKIVPKKDWLTFNRLVLMWGQNGCKPGSKKCVCDQLKID